MTDAEFLAEIKKRAVECTHADSACDLVYFINNACNADAPWRNWHCEKHNYSGSGAIPQCIKCKEENHGS